MTPQQFLNNPNAQEAVAQMKFTELYNKYGNWADVASVWFSGRPVSQAGNSKDVTGTTVPKYVNNILSMMGQPSGRQPNVQSTQQGNQYQSLQNRFNQFSPDVQAEIKAVYTGQKTIDDVTSKAKGAISGFLSQMPVQGNSVFKKVINTDKGRQSVEDLLNMTDVISGIKEIKPSVNTGPIAAQQANLGVYTGIGNFGDYQSLKNRTERLRASIQNQISGAALSEAEVRRLERFIPVVTDSDAQFDQKVKDLEKEYSDIMSNKAKTYGFKNFNDMVNYMSGGVSLPWESSQNNNDPLGLGNLGSFGSYNPLGL